MLSYIVYSCIRVSEDADISEDEDDNQSEEKYEDSFIDDQATPTETQTEQGGRHNGDMMGFYRYYEISRQLFFSLVLK